MEDNSPFAFIVSDRLFSYVCVCLKSKVRTGRNTETFRTSGVYDQISEDCAFSIIYGEMFDSLDLVAYSAEVANIWVTGLRYGHGRS